MTTTVHLVEDYRASTEQVLAALCDRTFLEHRNEATGDRLEELTTGPTSTTIVVVRTIPPDKVPAALQKFLPKGGGVTQTDVWPGGQDGLPSGTWKLEAPGTPATVVGTMRLEVTDLGCREVVEGTAKVGVPLVGGKLEKLLGDVIGTVVRRDAGVLRDWLARSPG